MPLPAQRRRVTADDGLVAAARRTACALLRDDHERLRHSAAVAAQAACLTDAVADDDAALLVAAAWLHDVGYASDLVDTAFHPVDGARHLRATGWDRAICDLVAHHSGSRFVAHARGLDDALREFTYTESPVSDALTVADQTMGRNGRPLTLEERMRDMLERHGPESANARAHPARAVYLRAAADRVTSRLDPAGLPHARRRLAGV